MATILVAGSVIIGILFGLRFKVLVLLPVLVASIIVVYGIGFVREDDVSGTTFIAASVAVALQLGYLCGSGLAFIVAALRERFARGFRGEPPALAGRRQR